MFVTLKTREKYEVTLDFSKRKKLCFISHEFLTSIVRTCNELCDGKTHIRIARTCHELSTNFSTNFSFEKSTSVLYVASISLTSTFGRFRPSFRRRLRSGTPRLCGRCRRHLRLRLDLEKCRGFSRE